MVLIIFKSSIIFFIDLARYRDGGTDANDILVEKNLFGWFIITGNEDNVNLSQNLYEADEEILGDYRYRFSLFMP